MISFDFLRIQDMRFMNEDEKNRLRDRDARFQILILLNIISELNDISSIFFHAD
jgi:hypothetical protein